MCSASMVKKKEEVIGKTGGISKGYHRIIIKDCIYIGVQSEV